MEKGTNIDAKLSFVNTKDTPDILDIATSRRRARRKTPSNIPLGSVPPREPKRGAVGYRDAAAYTAQDAGGCTTDLRGPIISENRTVLGRFSYETEGKRILDASTMEIRRTIMMNAARIYRLGEILIEDRIVSEEDIEFALALQAKNNKRLGEILIGLKRLNEEQLLYYLRQQKIENNRIIDSALTKRNKSSVNEVDDDFYLRNKEEFVYKTKMDWNYIKLATGIKIIDIQHVWLIMLSHYSSKLFKSLDFMDQDKEVDRVTDLLLDYAEEHFFVEEMLIESAGDTTDHIHQHRNFSKNFNLMRLQRIGDPDSSPSRKTLIDTSDFLRKWIVSHIAIHDMAYVKKIFHSRNKETIFENWVNRLKKSDKMTITTNQLALYKAVIDDATIQR